MKHLRTVVLADVAEDYKKAFTGKAAVLWAKLAAIHNAIPEASWAEMQKAMFKKKLEVVELYRALFPYVAPLRKIKLIMSEAWMQRLLPPLETIEKGNVQAISTFLHEAESYKRAYQYFKKQFMPTGSLSREAKDWIEWWGGTRGGARMPQPAVVNEFRHYVPQGPITAFRGIRFGPKIKIVKMGQAMTIRSKDLSSWSYDPKIADRFARYLPSADQFGGMMLFFQQMKEKKDFQGDGGFVVQAVLQPQDVLVDLTKTPDVYTGVAGEQEVVVLPNRTIKAKVIKVIK